MCEFKDRECLSFEEARKQYNNWNISDISGVPCTDDFHPIVKEKVFPILPIRPDTCIIRGDNKFDGSRGAKGRVVKSVINTSPAVVVLDGNDNYRSWTNEHNDILLHIEIHELCHINQQWNWIQESGLNIPAYDPFVDLFGNSSHDSYGKQFMKAVGYDTINSTVVPVGSPYRDLYNPLNRNELSAELCALYILDAIGARSIYDYRRYDSFKGYFQQVPIRDFDTSKYLTPEVVEWLETYMILPEIAD